MAMNTATLRVTHKMNVSLHKVPINFWHAFSLRKTTNPAEETIFFWGDIKCSRFRGEDCNNYKYPQDA